MKKCYQFKNFSENTLKVITIANAIIEEYRDQGYLLTLRQLYYQFVSRDLLANKTSEYKRLGSIINDARLAGFVDWEAIEDRTRNIKKLANWRNPSDIIIQASKQYLRDKWKTQPYRVEVWIEKEALAGVFQRVCESLDVPFFCCRGYVSQSEMWSAAQRLTNQLGLHQKALVLHFGDHDPSGIDMTRDIQDRFKMFGCDLELERMALNMDQIEHYNPPPNPAKETDSRFVGYIRNYGDSSWELDALEPQILSDLVRTKILDILDTKSWEDAIQRELDEKDLLRKAARNWDRVSDLLINMEDLD